MVDEVVDILIIGGGLIGASLMLALEHSGYCVALVDANQPEARVTPDFDARNLALSPASMCILEMLGIGSLMGSDPCPIKTIHISRQGGFGCTQLHGDDSSPLGHVVEMHHLNNALQHRLEGKKVFAPASLVALDKRAGRATIELGSKKITLQATLIVAADGTDSSIRKLSGVTARVKDYHQHAIVANIGLAREHHHMAYERFTPTGPLALLPMNGLRASLVWALSPEEAQRMMQSTDKDFLSALQRAFGYRLGRFTQVGRRVTYPLREIISDPIVDPPLVFIGNAAQTLHPVAGQGFNLGLRDVAVLAQCIIQKGLSTAMLTHYREQRQSDQRAIRGFTNGLIELFTCRLPGFSFIRQAGLIAFELLPGFKPLLTRYASGFSGVTPDLVCRIPLGGCQNET